MPRLFPLIGLLAWVSMPAFAADAFQEIDRNGDAALDRQELVVGALFQRADADSDAWLTAVEFHGPSGLHRDWDADGDLRLSEDEFYWAAFRYADQDRDQRLSREEFRVLEGWRR